MTRGAIMPELLQADVDLVKGEAAKLDAVNGLVSTDFLAWLPARYTAEKCACERLIDAGATIRFKSGATVIKFRGVRATSRLGLPGALRGWAFEARRKLS